MTKEQFERAIELDTEIQKYADLIGRIRLGVSIKRKEDEKSRKGIEARKPYPASRKMDAFKVFPIDIQG